MKKIIAFSIVFLIPVVVFAATGPGVGKTFNLLDTSSSMLQGLIGTLTTVVFGAALLGFFWGLVKYIWGGADDDKEKGKQIMIWGIIALFVMSSVWGIVRLLRTSLGVDSNTGSEIAPGIGVNQS